MEVNFEMKGDDENKLDTESRITNAAIMSSDDSNCFISILIEGCLRFSAIELNIIKK